jgi:hypothetical protein
MGSGFKASCGEIPVLLVGRSAAASALRTLLERFAHPVRQVPTWRAAEQAVSGMRVAILFSLPADLIGCADRLRAHARELRVILALSRADSEIEDLVMLREYLHLTVLGPNLESVHALVHDVLHVTPEPRPTALS